MAERKFDWSAQDVARVRELAAQGATARQIAPQIGRSRAAIYDLCRSRGIELRREVHPNTVTDADIERIEELLAQGLTCRAIGKIIGRSTGGVHNACVRHGIEVPRHKPKFGPTFSVPKRAFEKLSVAATARGLSVNHLARLLLERIAADSLVGAILDLPEPPPPKPQPMPPPPPVGATIHSLYAPRLEGRMSVPS
jgi:hypothetical protein